MDREKVIKGLACCARTISKPLENLCNGCPYDSDGDTTCVTKLTADALELLKAQEPVEHGYWQEEADCNGDSYYSCSVCGCYFVTIDGTPTENDMRYCPECGAKLDGTRMFGEWRANDG